MNFGFLGSSFGGMGRGGAAVDPYSTASILSALAGTGAMVFDPTNKSNLFRDQSATTPVTASGDPVGYNKDLLNGWNFIQGTAGARPAYNESGGINSLLFDGTDDTLLITSGAGLDIFKNCPYGTIIYAAKFTSDANIRYAINVSRNGSSSSSRFGSGKTAADKIQVFGRRLDSDVTGQSKASTADASGAWHVFTARQDWANTLQSIRIDLETAETGVPTWGAGVATSNTASTQANMGSTAVTQYMLGYIGRMAIIPQNISAALEEQIIRWAAQGAALEFPFDLFDYYVDSELGNDANAGTLQSSPLKTIAAIPSTAGVRIGLKRGSYWPESLSVSSGALVAAYGDLADPMPVLDCADTAGAWSKTVAQTNVYEQSWTHEYAAGKSYLSVWEDDDRLRWQSSIANCDANPGSYYVATPSGTTTTVYVHPKNSTDPTSDGKLYEISKRLKGLDLGAGTIGRNIRAKRPVHHNGAITLDEGASIYGCIGEDGCVHNIYLGPSAVAQDCIAWKADWSDRNTVTMFVAYTDDGVGYVSHYIRCIAKQDPSKITTSMLGFYCHTASNATPWDSIHLHDCATYGVYDGASFQNCSELVVERLHAAATRVAIRSRISGTVDVTDPWLHPVSGVSANADAIFIQQDNTGSGTIVGARAYTDNSSSAGSLISNSGTGSFEVSGCALVGDTVGSNLAGVGNSDNTTPMNFHHSIVYNLERAYNALGASAWTSDYNCCSPNAIDVRLAGTTHSFFSSYRSANPSRDVNSITSDPLLNDPANGDFGLQAGSPCIAPGIGLERPSVSYTAIPSDAELAAM